MAVHVVTDSTACLPQGYAEEHGVTLPSILTQLGPVVENQSRPEIIGVVITEKESL